MAAKKNVLVLDYEDLDMDDLYFYYASGYSIDFDADKEVVTIKNNQDVSEFDLA